jgi:hypothetical protein
MLPYLGVRQGKHLLSQHEFRENHVSDSRALLTDFGQIQYSGSLGSAVEQLRV